VVVTAVSTQISRASSRFNAPLVVAVVAPLAMATFWATALALAFAFSAAETALLEPFFSALAEVL
jgi:hypothetical protein